MAMEPLTERQQQVLDFVREYIRGHGFPPTLREIGDGVGIANLNAVRGHLAALEKKGRLLKSPDKARSIQIIEAPPPEPSPFSRFKRALHKVLRTDEGVVHRLIYGVAWATARQDRGPLGNTMHDSPSKPTPPVASSQTQAACGFAGPPPALAASRKNGTSCSSADPEFLQEKIANAVAAALDREAVERGWKIHWKKIDPGCVMVVVEAWPNHAPDRIVHRLQRAAEAAVRSHLKLPAKAKIWADGYVVTTEPESLEELAKEFSKVDIHTHLEDDDEP